MLKWARAITFGGLLAGSLDIVSAFAAFVPHGASEAGILRFIASGLIGHAALQGGAPAAALGLAVHFGLTTIMAAVFVVAALHFEVLIRRPWLSGLTYGVLIWGVMNYVVVPLSGVASWTPDKGWALVGALLGHCFYVGVPIAFAAHAELGAQHAKLADHTISERA